jgi:hypothetical protein
MFSRQVGGKIAFWNAADDDHFEIFVMNPTARAKPSSPTTAFSSMGLHVGTPFGCCDPQGALPYASGGANGEAG